MELNKTDKLLKEIRENYNFGKNYYQNELNEARIDIEFRAGKQWTAEEMERRNNRPTLVFSKLNTIVRHIVNNMRNNRPSIKVVPGNSEKDSYMSNIFQSIIHNIEKNSFAANIYDNAFESAVVAGIGYYQIDTDYIDDGFDLDIVLKPIDSIFNVYIDPEMKSNYEDYNWAILINKIPMEKFKETYPESKICSRNFIFDRQYIDFFDKNYVNIADYYYIDRDYEEKYLLSNGDIVLKKDYEEIDGVEIIRKRKVEKRQVKLVRTNGIEILAETIIPGAKNIPIIPVFGDTFILNGKRHFEGCIRQLRDIQRKFNHDISLSEELIQLAPKSPWLIAEGQIENYAELWKNSNRENYPYLPYKPVTIQGQTVPAPTRTQFSPDIQALTTSAQMSDALLTQMSGISDSDMINQPSSAESIVAQRKKSELLNKNYADNFNKSLLYAGKILVDMIPVVYDTERVIRISGDNQEEDRIITINSYNEDKQYWLNAGKFNVEIQTGSYGETQKQEAVQMMAMLFQTNPELFNICGDVFFKNQGWQGAQEVAKRIERILPPNVTGKEGELTVEELQSQLQQLQQETMIAQEQFMKEKQSMHHFISKLTSEANNYKNAYENKTAEIISKENIELLKAKVELLKAGIKEGSAEARMILQSNLSKQENLSDSLKVPEIVQEPEYVFTGINDPITEEEELTEEENIALDDLLGRLENYNPDPSRNMRA